MQDSEASSRINPAALATSTDTRVRVPHIQLAGQGPLNREILDNLIEHRDFDHLEEIGIGLVDHRNTLWTDVGLAVRHRRLEIGFATSGRLAGTPNEALARWARQGHFGIPPPAARFRVELGYLASLPIAYAWRVPTGGKSSSPVDVGLRFVPVLGRYEREVLQVNRSGDILHRKTAEEEGVSFGLDLGLQHTLSGRRPVQLGMVVRGIAQAGSGRLRQGRGIDLGAAFKPHPRVTMVGDLLNLGGNRIPARLSVGAEYAVRKHVTVRGAITTRGLAVGVGYRQLSLAYAADGDSLLGTSFAF